MGRGWDNEPLASALPWLPSDLREQWQDAGRQEADVDPIAYREHVVRRLLDRGVRPATLTTLLPDWQELIRDVAADPAATERVDAHTG